MVESSVREGSSPNSSLGLDPPAKILYQSFGSAENRPYLESLATTLSACGDAYQADVVVGTLKDTKLAHKQHRGFHLAGGAAVLEAVYRAGQEGFHAAVIGNIQDPALYECRQFVKIPVIGLCESIVSLTRPFGASLALIATSELVIPLLRENIARYGESHRLHSIRPANLDLGELSKAFLDREASGQLIKEFEAEAGVAVEEGAELVAPASGLLAALLAHHLGPRAGWDLNLAAPVINPIFLAVAGAALAAKAAGEGLTVSRRLSYQSPPDQSLSEYFNNPPDPSE